MEEFVSRKAVLDMIQDTKVMYEKLLHEADESGSSISFKVRISWESKLDAVKLLEVSFNHIPNADVAQVVHGEWKYRHEADFGWDEYTYTCSCCGFEVEREEFNFPSNYCPKCGAKMK